MGKACDVCGKKPQVGNNVSHANNKNKRRFDPNLQNVKIQTPQGEVKKIMICTRCLRSGAVQKPMLREKAA